MSRRGTKSSKARTGAFAVDGFRIETRSASRERIKPMTMLPESPRKILAGGRL